MASLKFFKMTSLPASLEADAFYFIKNGNFAESYVTDATGTAASIGNSAMIEAIADDLIATRLQDMNALEIVSTIAARDALDLTRNAMVLVSDASADPTVATGAALYAYVEAQDAFTKLAEYESMDVTLTWANISGRPTSSPTLIDDAVSKRHAHANKAQLDKISEAGGRMTYDGTELGGSWEATNW